MKTNMMRKMFYQQSNTLIFSEPTAESQKCAHPNHLGHFQCKTGCVTIRTVGVRQSKQRLRLGPGAGDVSLLTMGARPEPISLLQAASTGWAKNPYQELNMTDCTAIATVGEVIMYEQVDKIFLLFQFESYIPGVEMLPFEWAIYPSMGSTTWTSHSFKLYEYYYEEDMKTWPNNGRP